MSAATDGTRRRRLRGGPWGVVLVIVFALLAAGLAAGRYVWPNWERDYGHELRFDNAMFGRALEQPISFSSPAARHRQADRLLLLPPQWRAVAHRPACRRCSSASAATTTSSPSMKRY